MAARTGECQLRGRRKGSAAPQVCAHVCRAHARSSAQFSHRQIMGDPELAAAAYEAYRRALRMEYRKNSGILPVVRLDRSK
jgi:hypothetical protein